MALIRDWISERGNGKKEWGSQTAAIEKCLDCIKEYFECTICRDQLDKPIQTQCGHVFCGVCLKDLCGQPNPTCPLCKKTISNRSLVCRDDVGDMMELVGKMSGVFEMELKKFLEGKEKKKLEDVGVKKGPEVPTGKNTKVDKKKSESDAVQKLERIKESGGEKTKTLAATSSGMGNNGQAQGQKERSKSQLLERMMNQKYVIISANVYPEKPVDLSMPRKLDSIKYEYKPGAIRYVKPLDLTTRSVKRKLDEESEEPSDKNEKPPGISVSSKLTPTAISQQRKKGKFDEERNSKAGKRVESRKSGRASSKVAIDFENRYEDEECPLISAFTPTPPPPPEEKKIENNATKAEVRNAVTTTQNNYDLTSEVFRDFEFSFEEDGDQQKVPSTGKITSSDEILCKIADQSLATSLKLRKSQVPSGSSSRKSQGDTSSKKEDGFVFKTPTMVTSQAAKKKGKDEKSTKDDEDFMDFDDDFQQPRDSDLLFLDVNLSGTGAGSGKAGKSDHRSEGVTGRRLARSDSEKENGKSLHNGGKPKSPVKPSKPSTSKTVSKNVFAWDDDDDELPDVPEVVTSGKRSSGKSKVERPLTNVVRSKTPPESVSKQPPRRYVFCPTRLSKPQMMQLQEMCRMCEGTITKDFTEDVTHLVINLISGRVPQTLKYLQAIAGRKWVITYDWIQQSVEAGAILQEEKFETSGYKQCDPGVRRSRLAKVNLFEGFKFYFATEVYKSLGFTKSEVEMLMRTLGATIVTCADAGYRDLIIIGNKNGNSTEYNDWLNSNKWATVTFDWVIECILEYRLKPFESKHLCVDTSKVKSINAPKAFQAAFTQYLTQKSGMSPLSA